MKIGIVDLDTSHPQNWIPIERELGHEIVGVWDGGLVHPPEYVESFAKQHGIPRVYESLDQMADSVDCAIIHACDWDTHVRKARVFVDAGKSVLLDKPLSGNLADLRQLAEWSANGARITGGSSLRFAGEIRNWLSLPVAERGTPHTALCGCAVDEFNYGIHAYSMLCGIMGSGVHSVRHLGQGVQRRIEVKWADGRAGFLIVGTSAGWIPFYATIVTEMTMVQLRADSGKLYRSLLESVLPFLAGQTDQPPVAFDALIEAELCALAARRSWRENDREIRLSDLTIQDRGYDGSVFANAYRDAKYPAAASSSDARTQKGG